MIRQAPQRHENAPDRFVKRRQACLAKKFGARRNQVCRNAAPESVLSGFPGRLEVSPGG